MPPAAVLVPVKAFHRAKLRLAPVLDDVDRADLARAMAEVVLAAAGSLHRAVVCDDESVATWARSSGAEVIWTPGLGLNGAVEAGVAHLAASGVDRVVVAHSDLPLARDLAWVADFDGITLVPDRFGVGTNVLGLPARCGFRFAYGGGSFSRHLVEAERLGIGTRVVHSEPLGWDVDTPDDVDPGLVLLAGRPPR